MGLDLRLLQAEVVRQQGDVKRACLLLQGDALDSPVSPADEGQLAGTGDDILDWGEAGRTLRQTACLAACSQDSPIWNWTVDQVCRI